MGKSRRNNFLVQGSILAAASIISRLIGLVYRVPMTNIIGDEGIGYYNVAYSIYNIALILSSYSLPLAVSRLVAAKCVNKEYKSSYRIFIHALIFGAVSGLIMALIISLLKHFLNRQKVHCRLEFYLQRFSCVLLWV